MDDFILETTKSYLVQEVAPKANNIDSNPEYLLPALQGLGSLGFLALRVPHQWHGKEASEETFNNFQELIARYSGALAFLQTQHQSAASMLVASSNSFLQQQYLPRMGSGEVLLGVGFSQLRREGQPSISATPLPGGYQLDGVVPWVTGYNLFLEFIVAATLPDGSNVFGIVPFQETDQKGGTITFSKPAELAAMTSTNTVTASLKSYFLPDESVVFLKKPDWIHQNDKNNILRATFATTGCALASLDIIQSAAEQTSLPFITNAFESLQQELNTCRTAIREVQQDTSIEFAQKLQLRSWAIELAVRIAHAAVTVSRGGAIYSHYHAQRIYREALVFTVTGQTSAVMEATLQRLVR